MRKWKYIDDILKVFSKTTGPISTKLETKHPRVKGIQIFQNEGPHLFPRGDNCEMVKIQYPRLKIFLSRNIRPISFKLSTKQPWVKGISGYPIKFLSIFKMEMMGFFLSKKILHV